MNVTVEDISSIKKKLSFELAPERVDAEIEKAYRKIGQKAKIKGFRAGKVPRSILEQYYAPQMEEQVLDQLIKESYFKALVDHQIPVVSDPEIQETTPLEKGKPFSYQVEVEVKPEVEAKDYSGLSLQRERFEPDAQVVEGRLEEMRGSRAQMEPVEREEAANGDFVTIDFEGFIDEVPFEGGKAEGHVLELGSGSFIPGFEEQLEGMKKGEEREVQVSFPENYGQPELAGKPALFRVALKEIKEKVLPSLDDEFAKGFGLESLDELKEKLDQGYRDQEQKRIEEELRERLMAALIAANPIEVPSVMVDHQLDYMLGNLRRRLETQGMKLEMLGMNDESFKASYRPQAVSQVQGSLILEAIGRQEEIRVEAEEIDGKLEQIAEMANAPLEAVKKHYAGEEARRGLIGQIEEEKVVQFLLDQSVIEEVDKAQLSGAQSEEEPEKE